MSNIPQSLYIAFALAEQLFSLINNSNLVNIAYSKCILNYMYVKLPFSKTESPSKKLAIKPPYVPFKRTVV